MEQQWICSYGCVGKYKNSCVLQWLCMLHKRHKVPHIWNYFETRHGKRELDRAGACIKIALRRKEMKFTTILLIRDENTIVAWCCSVMGQGAIRKEDQSSQKAHVHRYFWEVFDVDRSHLYECKTVQGPHAFHSVLTSHNAIIEMWLRKTCFCYPCSSGE